MPDNSRYVAVLDLNAGAAIAASGGTGQAQYTNDAGDSALIINKIDFAVTLAASVGGAIVGTEVAPFPSPTAADNTHVTRAQFTVEMDDGTNKWQNAPIPLSSLLNPQGETFIEPNIVIPPGRRLTVKLTNNTTTATVLAKATFSGKRVPWTTAP